MIEVLVAIVILGFVALVIVGSVSVMVRLNVESSREIDVSRAVRTVSEKARNRWADPEFWSSDGEDGMDPVAKAELEFAGYPELAESGCVLEILPTSDAATSIVFVRVLSITCPLVGRPGEFEVFEVEFGEPR